MMYKRRTVIKSLACAAAGVALRADRGLSRVVPSAGDHFVSMRPAAGQRKFVSDAVEAKIVEVKRAIADPELKAANILLVTQLSAQLFP